MAQQGYRDMISLTRNPRLQALYRKLGFAEGPRARYARRLAGSPGATLFHKPLDGGTAAAANASRP
jgi:hypothetical protein